MPVTDLDTQLQEFEQVVGGPPGVPAPAVATDLAMVANQPPKPRVDNKCPFGCTLEDLDDHGYCKHLVGFTNDKPGIAKDYEPLKWMTWGFGRHKGERNGHRFVDGKDKRPILATDKMVNPLMQDDRGRVWRKNPSWRVYREVVDEEEQNAPRSDMTGEHNDKQNKSIVELTREMDELKRQLEIAKRGREKHNDGDKPEPVKA